MIRIQAGCLALGAAVVMAACSTSPSPTPSGLVDHPVGSHVVVLRLDDGPWYHALFEMTVTHTPNFTLYGDGMAIYRAPARGDGLSLVPLRRAALDQAEVSSLLRFALHEGGLADAVEEYVNESAIDWWTTTFTVDAGGYDKTVNVWALDAGPRFPRAPDANMRVGFQALAAVLRDFDRQVAAGRASSAGIFEPTLYRAVLWEASAATAEVREWPWPDLGIDAFLPPAASAVVSPEHARRVSDNPQGGVAPIAVRGPDGVIYMIALRPLLPDETR